MSWLFGGGNPPPPNDGDDNNDGDYDDYDDYDDDVDNTKVISDFDATALVKGAEALKAIDASSNSKDVLRLALQQERTKQAEAKLRAQQLTRQNMEYKQSIMEQQHKQQQERDRQQREAWQEQQKREQQQKAQLEKELLDQKKRQQDDYLQKQKQFNEEKMRKEQEHQRQLAAQRQKEQEEIEKKKRATLDYQAKLDRETAKIKVKAETDGKMKLERQNEDIHLRKSKQELEENRITKLDLRKEELLAYSNLMSGVRDLITDRDKLKIMGGGIIGITAGVVGVRRGINLISSQIEKHWGKPSLIRETSRWSFKDFQPKRSWFNSAGRYQSRELKKRIKDMNVKLNDKSIDQSASASASVDFNGIILSPAINNKVKFITRCTQQTKINNAPFRHLLIYGPPGTGKTLFARMLAQQSGLDYAILTGADFQQLGGGAVQELHRIFDWAETSSKGTILFIDEADAFLRKGRESDKMSENMRNALSAFLYRTGTETKDFMIVLASNVPEALDKAVIDRIDDMIEFNLPSDNERLIMLKHYFDVYITQNKQHANISSGIIQGRPIEIEGFNDDEFIWDRLTEKTTDFSGRQIAKYMIQVQAAIYGGMGLLGNDNKLTPFLMEQILESFLKTKAFEMLEQDLVQNKSTKTLKKSEYL